MVLGEHPVGGGADQFVAGRAGDAADHHEPHLGADDQVGGDVHRVGHDGDAGPLGEHPGQLAGGGSAAEAHHRALRHEPGGRLRDPALLLPLLLAPVAQRQFEVDRAGHGAAPGAVQQSLLVELLEIAADGRGRDVQQVGERMHIGAPRFTDVREDPSGAISFEHGVSLAPPSRGLA